ncbi:hypothetical protein [Nocardioides sp. B-3]|uniref:hypothetical protein n=1 Tax=Nocardioides sp. B-3 TaxID=2895565 RepID=UPI0021525066|nr:hypothetical protein [Nocardioides sp. B-3]UUZ58368.1 hypothetical protein LP418_19510 [Nocardioides sp. B-3]
MTAPRRATRSRPRPSPADRPGRRRRTRGDGARRQRPARRLRASQLPRWPGTLAQLAVWTEQDDALVGDALVEAVCEQLAVRGHGQVTTLVEAGATGPGFEPFTPEEPRASHQLALEAEADLTASTPARRTLRRHRTNEELHAFLPTLDASPKDEGTVRLVVRRPAVGQREVLALGELDPAVGLVGDSWDARGSRRTPDGAAHPRHAAQRDEPPAGRVRRPGRRARGVGRRPALPRPRPVTREPARMEPADVRRAGRRGSGDRGDGPAAQRLRQVHRATGKDAMAFVNGPEGKPRRLRGLCARRPARRRTTRRSRGRDPAVKRRR